MKNFMNSKMKSKAIFFMTGMSNYGNTTLSPIQQNFLNNLSISDDVQKIFLNFPYMYSDMWKPTNILMASVSNTYQYLQAKYMIKENYKKSCLSLFTQYEEIFILAGSCGLEIFNSLKLDESLSTKINIFAYGAVAGRIPKIKNIWLIKGSKDLLAMKQYDLLIQCGHMNYLEQPELKNFIEERIK